MKRMASLLTLAALLIACLSVACSRKVAGETSGSASAADSISLAKRNPVIIGYRSSDTRNKSLPKATAFRMSGDFADNVAVSLNDDGKLSYYPAPTDISLNSRPIDLGNGWWLNRQGIGKNSKFTKFTFEEYASLTKTPSQEELIKSIIPDAYVTDMVSLPFDITQASGHIEEIKEYLKNEK